MKKTIMKAMKYNQIMTMIYLSKDGAITQRRIKVLKLSNNTISAYCFTRGAKRTFYIENILAITPLTCEERKVY